MKMFFFISDLRVRDDAGNTRPTLRALPDQTFEDGTGVSTALNVHSPKEAGSCPTGARLDYPMGTIFACDHLELVHRGEHSYYSVYGDDDISRTPNFHPVDTGDGFRYVKEEHRDEQANALYALFRIGITPTVDTPRAEPAVAGTSGGTLATRRSPADGANARRFGSGTWKGDYEGQIEREAFIYSRWVSQLFADKTLSLMGTPSPQRLQDILADVYSAGESLDSVINRSRFETFLKKKLLDYDDFAMLPTETPQDKYLLWLLDEHSDGSPCTAQKRRTTNRGDLADIAFAVTTAFMITGKAGKDRVVQKSIGDALKAGWTVDDMVLPANMALADGAADMVAKMAMGIIEMPKREAAAAGRPYIDTIMADGSCARPGDDEGFHVDEKLWKTLVYRLKRHINTLITGPQGSGKTEVIRLLCERTGTPCRIFQMGGITDPSEQLVGKPTWDTATGAPRFDYADFAMAIQRPGVIILDEINRTPKNGMNILFGVLDGTRTLACEGAYGGDSRQIKVHPDCCFMATANFGAQFTGTTRLDEALADRFRGYGIIEVDYLGYSDEVTVLRARTGIGESDAKNIALVAMRVRDWARNRSDYTPTVSTRMTLGCASMVRDGFPVQEALESVLLPPYDNGKGDGDATSERAQVRQIISQRFNSGA